MNNEEWDTYSFYYEPYDGKEERSHTDQVLLPWDAPWTQVLGEFLTFLEDIYGYSVKDQVAVLYNPNRDPAGWTGKVFHEDTVMLRGEPVQLDLFDIDKHNYGGSD